MKATIPMLCATAAAVFVVAFWSAREIRWRTTEPTLPALVKHARAVDGLPSVSANRAVEASRTAAEQPVFIDLRTNTEFAVMHIPGALNVQNFLLPDAIEQLPVDRAWVMYCTCPDDRLARWAVETVRFSGRSNAVVLQHGLQAWRDAGGAVATPDGTQTGPLQGCGCTQGAEAYKLWVVGRAQARAH